MVKIIWREFTIFMFDFVFSHEICEASTDKVLKMIDK